MTRPWRFLQDEQWDAAETNAIEKASEAMAATAACSATLTVLDRTGQLPPYVVSTCLVGEIEVAVLISTKADALWGYR